MQHTQLLSELMIMILFGMLNLNQIGQINVDTLWANIGATKNPLRSFTLSLDRFVGLIDTDNKKNLAYRFWFNITIHVKR